MASAAPRTIERVRTRPLPPAQIAIVASIVWVAGALYCSGYERLMSGLDNWPGSLWWSAAAVLPWLALFEWSKTSRGRETTRPPWRLAAVLLATAAASLLLEYSVNLALGDGQSPLALAVMRRLPAIGTGLLLILWARVAVPSPAEADETLAALAPAIRWIAAADNYVELHLGDRVVMRRMTLREAERAFGTRGFIRIHRRFVVDRARIADVVGNGKSVVRLDDGTELPLGRAYAANLLRAR